MTTQQFAFAEVPEKRWYTHSMRKPHAEKQKTVLPSRPRWLYLIGGLVLLCFALALVPGGQAMPLIGIWIAGWAACMWSFQRYKWVRILVTIAFILIAIGVVFIISTGQASQPFYGS